MFNWNTAPLACNPRVVSFLSFMAQISPSSDPPKTHTHTHAHTRTCALIHAAHSLLESLFLLWYRRDDASEALAGFRALLLLPGRRCGFSSCSGCCDEGLRMRPCLIYVIEAVIHPLTATLHHFTLIASQNSLCHHIYRYLFIVIWMNDPQFGVYLLSL